MEKRYFLQENGKASQPYSLEDLRAKNLTVNTLVCEKFGNWKLAKDIPELAELLEWQPPMPSESNWVPPPPQVQTPIVQQSQQQAHQQNQPTPPQYTPPPNPQPQTIIVMGQNRKSTGVAFLLSFFFGPLGLFYASVTGGVIMLLVSVIVGIFTFGIGLIFTQITCVIWAMVSVNNHNENLNNPPVLSNQPQQPNQQQFQPYQQPSFTLPLQQSVTTPVAPQPPEQPIQEQPLSQPPWHVANLPYTEPLSEEATSPEIEEQLKTASHITGNFNSKYKIPLIIGSFVITAGFVGYKLFLKKAPLQTATISVSNTDERQGGEGGIENAVPPISIGYVQTQKGSNLRLRSQPSEQAPVIASIPNGTTVTILGYSPNFEVVTGEKGKWCSINFNGNIGWAWGGFIKTNTLNNSASGLNFNILGAYNNKDKDNIVNLRENPNGRILKKIPIGETFYYIPSSSDWSLVKTKDGVIGFISTDRIQPISDTGSLTGKYNFDKHGDIHAFIDDLAKALEKSDKNTVAQMAHFPLPDEYGDNPGNHSQTTLGCKSANQFIEKFNKIFTPEIVMDIKAKKYRGFINQSGPSPDIINKGEYLIEGTKNTGMLGIRLVDGKFKIYSLKFYS